MSSRLFLGLIVLIAIATTAYILFMRGTEPLPQAEPNTSDEAAQMRSYSSDKYGVSFIYPDEYQLTEFDAPGSALREQHTIVLQHTDDLPAPEGGEGPPSITIDIYQNNLDNQTTEGWIRSDSRSNFKLGEMTLASTTIDGKQALSYRWSGLYEGTTVATAEKDWIYAFNVTYLEMGADIIQDFVTLRESVRFR
jgi:hypothetical protein